LTGTSTVVSGACFSSEPTRMTLTLPLFGDIQLDDAQMVGGWGDGDPAEVSEGWLRGFVSEATAMKTTLQGQVPPELSLVGIQSGTPLTNFLPSGQREMGSSGQGWWFLVEFAAKPAAYTADQ
ncbi:MAG TPA: hypothetical protein VG963_10580, partial [Polyangiaceae bacterium]|nr:hypothetical protein [Polyangiaceae bacterium]